MREFITVNYNTPDLVLRLVRSIRYFYKDKITVVDGSNPEMLLMLYKMLSGFDNVHIVPFGYNVHHGAGMNAALSFSTADKCVLVDSDNIIKQDFLDRIPDVPIFGFYCYTNEDGLNKGGRDESGHALSREETDEFYIKYYHPLFMVIDPEYYRSKSSRFINHGAPCIRFMENIQHEIEDVAVDMCEYFGIEYDDLEKYFTLVGKGTRLRFGMNLNNTE